MPIKLNLDDEAGNFYTVPCGGGSLCHVSDEGTFPPDCGCIFAYVFAEDREQWLMGHPGAVPLVKGGADG